VTFGRRSSTVDSFDDRWFQMQRFKSPSEKGILNLVQEERTSADFLENENRLDRNIFCWCWKLSVFDKYSHWCMFADP